MTWSTDGELTALARPGGLVSSLAYDGLGRISRVTTPAGVSGAYVYDGLGRRVALRVGGQIQRRYVYGGGSFPRARVDGAGSVIERYVYGGQAHVPQVIVRRDGQRLRLITDALGSVRAVVDIGSGQLLQRLSYDAYGRVTQDTSPGLQPFGFKGALSDPVAEGAGLVWMGVRAYVPSLGRFATPDPAGVAAAWNEHDAFAGDPVNLIDADGFAPEVVETVITRYAGFWDGMTGGWTRRLRESQAGGDPVDTCRDDYNLAIEIGGLTAATMVTVATEGFGELAIGARSTVTLGRAGKAAKAPSVLRVGEVKLPGVPRGAVGKPVRTGKGTEYAIPKGTPELDPRVTHIRVMDPVTSGRYKSPNGYANYMNREGQTVDPLSGMTIGRTHPNAHIPLR